MKHNHARATGLASAAVVVGLVTALGAGSAAYAADEPIVGQGHVTLDFSVTPGSVTVQVWTKNLSEVEAWGRAVVVDVDGTPYPFGARHFAPGEEYVYSKTLADYTCADLGNASAVAFGFGTESGTAPDWTSGIVRYPDARITVIGCDTVSPAPTDRGDPGTTPTPTDGTTPTTPAASTPSTSAAAVTTPTGRNSLPAAKTDGALHAERPGPSPLFGLLVTAGVIAAAAVGRTVAGAFRRR
ncbi:hypothetical protein G5T42_04415 [Microbacterium sp. 4R-513]|uniref:hypothetical protein n=1 Tax=Microbacterium sp. 4R-513 TaxID=2567934 RepID=UPI0013E0EEF5|nr:hypothetical protein [Microbacterium sp. 4R-513]QIG38823.1 hypothetical protein G5T42_04415 [Microbacterium sp. 4R-513]